jgi:hypothetical protein
MSPAEDAAAKAGWSNEKIIVAVVVGVVVLALAYFLLKSGSTPTEACAVSAAAVGAAAIAIHQQESARVVLDSTLLAPVCLKLMEKAIEQPTAPVNATILLPNLGGSVEFTGTGQELSERVVAGLPGLPHLAPEPNYQVTQTLECALEPAALGC